MRTNSTVDYLPSSDTLHRDGNLAYSVAVSILGVDVRCETNSRDVLDLFSETAGNWTQRLAQHAAVIPDPLAIRVIVHAGAESESANGHSAVRHLSANDGRLFVHSSGSVAIVDPLRRESLAYVTAELVADREHFRVTVLEAITFALIACFDRHPLHAAAIGDESLAVLLAGPSGAGKSTLAYLAHTAGIGVLSEDRVWVQLEPALQIWSGSPCVHLRSEALAHFPELSRHRNSATPTASKPRIVLEPASSSTEKPGLPARRAVVCVLARGHQAALEPLDGFTVQEELRQQTAPGFDRFPERHQHVLRELAAGGGWRLTLSSTPVDALPFLRRMLEER